jgi:hypothetical protein
MARHAEPLKIARTARCALYLGWTAASVTQAGWPCADWSRRGEHLGADVSTAEMPNGQACQQRTLAANVVSRSESGRELAPLVRDDEGPQLGWDG